MEWKHDPHVMDLIRNYLVNQKDDLNELLTAIHAYNDGTPPYQFLQIFGVFVVRYSEHIQTNTETDALELTLAEIANHPSVQLMVSSMMSQGINRGLNLE